MESLVGGKKATVFSTSEYRIRFGEALGLAQANSDRRVLMRFSRFSRVVQFRV